MPSAEITEYDVLHEFTYLSDIESQKEGEFATSSYSDDPCSVHPTRRSHENLLLFNAYNGYKQNDGPLLVIDDSEMLIDDYIINELADYSSSASDKTLLSPLSPYSTSSYGSPFLLETPDTWLRTCSPNSVLSSPESPESSVPILDEGDHSTPNSPQTQQVSLGSGSKTQTRFRRRALSKELRPLPLVASTISEQNASYVKRDLSASVSSFHASPLAGSASLSGPPILENDKPGSDTNAPHSPVTGSKPPTERAAEVPLDCSREDKVPKSIERADVLDPALSASQATDKDDNSNSTPGCIRSTRTRSMKRAIDYAEEADDEDEGSDYHDDIGEEPVSAPRKRRSPGGGRRISPKRKVFPCPAPTGKCSQTFTRRGDAERHMKNAKIHADLAVQEEAAESRRCPICNADLSRSDARKRHSNAEACGKRRMSTSKHIREEHNEVQRNRKSRRLS